MVDVASSKAKPKTLTLTTTCGKTLRFLCKQACDEIRDDKIREEKRRKEKRREEKRREEKRRKEKRREEIKSREEPGETKLRREIA